MNRTVTRFLHDEDAQDLIEYALLAALLAVACIAGILQLTGIKDFFARAGAALASAL
jgi:Flp pilus assembly pilin Flp